MLLALAAALLVLPAVVLGAMPSWAASDQLGLSWDGTTWSTALDGTLFNRAGSIRLWVPGDTDTETFYVRNQSSDGAQLAVDYDLPPAALLSDFTLSVSMAGGAWLPLTPSTGWAPVDGTMLGRGEQEAVAVKAVFDPASTNQSQTEAFPIDFRVTLTQALEPQHDTHPGKHPGKHGGSADDNGPGPGGLPDTGAPEVRWAVGIGLLCLGGGIGVVVLSRRKERHDAEAS
jgi:hypothetical protein